MKNIIKKETVKNVTIQIVEKKIHNQRTQYQVETVHHLAPKDVTFKKGAWLTVKNASKEMNQVVQAFRNN